MDAKLRTKATNVGKPISEEGVASKSDQKRFLFRREGRRAVSVPNVTKTGVSKMARGPEGSVLNRSASIAIRESPPPPYEEVIREKEASLLALATDDGDGPPPPNYIPAPPSIAGNVAKNALADEFLMLLKKPIPLHKHVRIASSNASVPRQMLGNPRRGSGQTEAAANVLPMQPDRAAGAAQPDRSVQDKMQEAQEHWTQPTADSPPASPASVRSLTGTTAAPQDAPPPLPPLTVTTFAEVRKLEKRHQPKPGVSNEANVTKMGPRNRAHLKNFLANMARKANPEHQPYLNTLMRKLDDPKMKISRDEFDWAMQVAKDVAGKDAPDALRKAAAMWKQAAASEPQLASAGQGTTDDSAHAPETHPDSGPHLPVAPGAPSAAGEKPPAAPPPPPAAQAKAGSEAPPKQARSLHEDLLAQRSALKKAGKQEAPKHPDNLVDSLAARMAAMRRDLDDDNPSVNKDDDWN